jgi:transglutaminase-like putative cysteine protease
MQNDQYTRITPLLDYGHPVIDTLVRQRSWEKLPEFERIGAVYNFVKDEILFGYNASDNLPASLVLKDGYGQCNTKSTLFMALLRRLGIACRFHGFTIYNSLQKGAVPAWLFFMAPSKIIHSWVEVRYKDNWVALEGLILDADYLQVIQRRFCHSGDAFSGYGVATKNLADPQVSWCGKNTYIQKEGIADDFGVYDDPDAFYTEWGTNLSGIKKWLYVYIIRHLMNRNVAGIRQNHVAVRQIHSKIGKIASLRD